MNEIVPVVHEVAGVLHGARKVDAGVGVRHEFEHRGASARARVHVAHLSVFELRVRTLQWYQG